MKVCLEQNSFFVEKGDVINLIPTKNGTIITFNNVELGINSNLNIKNNCIGVVMNKFNNILEIAKIGGV